VGRTFKQTLGRIKRSLFRNWYEVSIEECCNPYAMRFGGEGWHFLVETLRELENNQNIPLQETILYQYHKQYCPTVIGEIFQSSELSKQYEFEYPWGNWKNKGPYGRSKPFSETRYQGPSSDDFIKKQYDNIVSIYESMKIEGYRPLEYGFIGGTFLLSADQERLFVVHQGNHRMAALTALGVKKIKVVTIKGFIKNINEKQVDNWHYVKTGKWRKDDALKLFRSFYTENGNHIVSGINLSARSD